MLKHFFPNPSNRKLQNVPGRLKMHSRATTDFFILCRKSDFDNYFVIFRKFYDISKIFIEPSNIFRKIFFRFFFYFRKLRYNSFPTHYSTPKKSSGSPRTSILKNLKKTWFFCAWNQRIWSSQHYIRWLRFWLCWKMEYC